MSIKSTFLVLLIIISLLACNSKRFITEQIIGDVRQIRNAEEEYKQKYGQGNYGSINVLIAQGLLAEGFREGKEYGYKFNLIDEKDHYHLNVIPESWSNGANEEEFSLFVDETKVIRANVYSSKPADSKSEPIADEYRKLAYENKK